MTRRTQALGIGIAAVLAAGVAGIGPAAAVPGGEIVAKGKPSFAANRFVFSNQRFTPDIKFAASGGTVMLRNADGNGEPHTFTLANISDRPQTINEVFECAFCGEIAAKQFPSGPNGEELPPVPVVDGGKPGLDQRGDSWLLEPGESVSVPVAAPAGTNLYFMCIIHPWMQARINVR